MITMISFYNKIFGFMALLIPLIFTGLTFESYEFPKMFFVYFVGSTVIWLFLMEKILRGSGERVKFLNKWIFLLLMSFFVSTIFSSHIYTSLWGYYKRFNGGLVSVLIFVGLYVVLTNKLKFGQIVKVIEMACFSLIPVSVFGLVQFYYFNYTRVTSTFGQPNWLAAYIVMLLPFVLFKAISKASRGEGVFWSFVFILSFSCLWLTFSMSGLLGFFGGIGLFIYLNQNLVKSNFKQILTVFVLCGVFAFFNPGILAGKIRDIFLDIQKVQAQEEILSPVQNEVSDPLAIRFGIWQGSWNLFKSSPKIILIGTGPETFSYDFQEFRPASLNYSSEWNFVLNKPHNYYLEILVQNGSLGFFAYAGLIISTLRKKHKFLTPALFGFYLTNIFSWPVVATAFLFWVFVAGLEVKNENE